MSSCSQGAHDSCHAACLAAGSQSMPQPRERGSPGEGQAAACPGAGLGVTLTLESELFTTEYQWSLDCLEASGASQRPEER